MLDRAQAGAGRTDQVVGGDVALEVYETGCTGGSRHEEDQHGGRVRFDGHLGEAGRLAGVALGLDRSGTGGRALREDPGQVEDAVRAARDLDGLAAGVGNEGAEGVVVAQLAASLTEQVGDGVPAAGDQQQVDGELPRPCGLAVRGGRHGGEPRGAFGGDDGVSGQHLDTGLAGAARPLPGAGRVSTITATSTPAAARSSAAA